MIEFDPITAPTETIMVKYFKKSLKPSIKAEIDPDATHLDDYEEFIAKVVRAKAKEGPRPSSFMQKADLQVLQKSRPIHTTAYKVQM